jgi:hypothetical protein
LIFKSFFSFIFQKKLFSRIEDFVDVGFDFGELFAAVGEELGGCFDFGG